MLTLLRRFAPLWAVLLLLSGTASAGDRTCPTEGERAHLDAFRERLTAAPTPEAAKDLALGKTRLAHKALRQASRVVRDNREIALAEAKLEAFETDVRAAKTQEEVAARFGALSDTQMAQCEYTTTEIVIIVIGFVLGILPGILFLFLFC